jgi:hypothetical protein
MTSLHASPSTVSPYAHQVPGSLETEASELEALNAGLKRHVTAWRTAHDSAVTHMTELLARMDAVIERAERNLRT